MARQRDRILCRLFTFYFFCFVSALLIYFVGHPVPGPNMKPATEGPRKGLLPPFPRTAQEENWLRGAWPTDRNGVAQFTSLFHLLFRRYSL